MSRESQQICPIIPTTLMATGLFLTLTTSSPRDSTSTKMANWTRRNLVQLERQKILATLISSCLALRGPALLSPLARSDQPLPITAATVSLRSYRTIYDSCNARARLSLLRTLDRWKDWELNIADQKVPWPATFWTELEQRWPNRGNSNPPWSFARPMANYRIPLKEWMRTIWNWKIRVRSNLTNLWRSLERLMSKTPQSQGRERCHRLRDLTTRSGKHLVCDKVLRKSRAT